jgi:lauroyl/myristoyl acyltransferase
MEKRLRRLPDQLYFFGLLPALSLLPASLGARLIRRQGHYLRRSLRDHAESINRNLASCGFDHPEQIVRAFFEIMAAEDLDAFYFRDWRQSSIDRYFDFAGLSALDEALTRSRGALLLTGHIGALASALVALALKGRPVTHVSRGYPSEQSLPPAFLRYALRKVKWMEEKMGGPLIYAPSRPDPEKAASTSLEILAALRAGKLVSMAIDVIPDMAPERAQARFFGRTALFPTNFLRIAYASDAPVVPFFTVRRTADWTRQLATFEPPIQLTGTLAEDLQRCVSWFEGVIGRFPEQWFSWDALPAFWKDNPPAH